MDFEIIKLTYLLTYLQTDKRGIVNPVYRTTLKLKVNGISLLKN